MVDTTQTHACTVGDDANVIQASVQPAEHAAGEPGCGEEVTSTCSMEGVAITTHGPLSSSEPVRCCTCLNTKGFDACREPVVNSKRVLGQADALLGPDVHVGHHKTGGFGNGRIWSKALGFNARDLEGGLDVAVHHLDVRLVDGHRAAGERAGLVDGHGAQLRGPLPVLLQNQQQLLQPHFSTFMLQCCLYSVVWFPELAEASQGASTAGRVNFLS
jgi:hypothetical protein